MSLPEFAGIGSCALALVQPDSQTTIGQDLTDYRLLFDQDVKPQPDDDLTAWIRSFQAGGAGAAEKWRANHSLPWLVAALQGAGPHDTGLAELLAAAAAVKADSPAFLTVSYQRVRLLPPEEARTIAGEVLAGKIIVPARNQFRAERMRLARDFDDFLQYAARQPIAEMTYEVALFHAGEDYLDGDAAEVFDYDLPLALLKQAAGGKVLPDRIRHDLQRAISVRELVLSDAPPFDRVFALLKTPGERPFVDAGSGRFTREPDKVDPYRDNWWCSATADNVRNLSTTAAPPQAAKPFLTAAQRAQANAEVAKLNAAGNAPNWMAAQTLTFAQRHPQDPRIPEALYLVVHATRFGCTDSQTGDFSRRAFDLLHTRYPSSEWTKKTPYWFK